MKKLEILTGNDLITHDISKMNNYFDNYISELKEQLNDESIIINESLSAADIGIMAEIVNLGIDIMTSGNNLYMLDFDSLPQNIKDGLRSGKYKLGESRQVNGNLRPTVVDVTQKSTPRVKDVTIKEVKHTVQSGQIISNLMMHIQMKQMAEQINELCDMSRYLVKRHRDRELKEPFFKARNYIGDAQATIDEGEQRRFLSDALRNLEEVIQAAYQYMNTDAQFLEEKTRSPLRRYKDKIIRLYMGYICEDIFMLNKSLGLSMQIFNYLGKVEEAKRRLLEYIEVMYSFSQTKIGNTNRTAVGVLQDNFPYNKKNFNMWIVFNQNILKTHEEISKIDSFSHTYLICAGGENDDTV